jgi:hypothetical protein
MRKPIKFHWKGLHHSYTGAWFVAFGLFSWYMCIDNGELATLIPFWQGLIGTGVFFIVDDVWEHKISGNTPLRIIYEKVIIPWLKK